MIALGPIALLLEGREIRGTVVAVRPDGSADVRLGVIIPGELLTPLEPLGIEFDEPDEPAQTPETGGEFSAAPSARASSPALPSAPDEEWIPEWAREVRIRRED